MLPFSRTHRSPLRWAKHIPKSSNGLSVSANFFSVLGSTPILGRTFSPDEAQNGRNQGVILSWSAWRRLFHANPSADRQLL